MRARASACACALAAIALIEPGCGANDEKLPRVCLDGARAVATALRKAPDPVRLADGMRLSTCVKRARRDADLKAVGTIYTAVADGLATHVRSSDTAALQLGYLVAAARRGASTTNGTNVELVRRLEQSAGIDGPPPSHRAAYGQGLAAGARTG